MNVKTKSPVSKKHNLTCIFWKEIDKKRMIFNDIVKFLKPKYT